MKRIAIIVSIFAVAGFFLLNYLLFGNRSSFQTGLVSFEGLPKTASDITVFQNKNISGDFIADFKIAEPDLEAFASSNGWLLQTITNRELIFYATAFHEGRANEKKEIIDGLYYSKRGENGGGITIAYDRKNGRGYIQSSSR